VEMRVAVLAVTLAWLPALCVGAPDRTARQQQDHGRRKRQALLGTGGGCADMSLFNYLLYYYLIQAQNAHEKHAQADQMAGALLKLKQRRGTDPLPTLISTPQGQAALLAMLQSVAQNNPSQLLNLLTSIRGGQPAQQQQQQPFGGGFGGYRQPAALTGFPPTGGSAGYGALQGSSALYSPQVQQAFYHQQQQLRLPTQLPPQPALRPFGVSAGARDGEKVDNSLQFSPSLRRQVYAEPVALEPTPPPRTVVRPPSTRLHVSTVTLVTTVLTSRASTVPLLFNGQQTSTEIMHTDTHVLTATQLRTLAVVVTPTVVEANGQTTTLYGGTGAPSAEIVTDVTDFHDEPQPTPPLPPPPQQQQQAQVAPPLPSIMQQISQQQQQAPQAVPASLLAAIGSVQPLQVLSSGQQLTAPVGALPPLFTLQSTPPPTTTTQRPKPNQLLELLKFRAKQRRRGTPLRGAARRRYQQEQQEKQQQQQLGNGHVSTSVSVSVSSPGQPPTPVPLGQPPAPVFLPQQVPVYVERDGVLVVLPAKELPATAAPASLQAAPVYKPAVASTAGPVLAPEATTPVAPVFQPATAAPVATSAPPATAAAAATAAPITTTATPTTSVTTSPTLTTTTASTLDDFGFDFEETVYASESSTEKVVTEEDFQSLLDGTFVILAQALPDTASTTAATSAASSSETVEGSGGGTDSDVKVSVSYAVSTSVSEGR